jgi:hypothetical protein
LLAARLRTSPPAKSCDWEISDPEGRLLDPSKDRVNFDGDLTFTAIRWEPLEASLVTAPADAAASIRSHTTRSVLPNQESSNGMTRVAILRNEREGVALYDEQTRRVQDLKAFVALVVRLIAPDDLKLPPLTI